MKHSLTQIRRLHVLVARAYATLTPLSQDGVGRDSEGAAIPNVPMVLDRAMQDIKMAATIVEEMENS